MRKECGKKGGEGVKQQVWLDLRRVGDGENGWGGEEDAGVEGGVERGGGRDEERGGKVRRNRNEKGVLNGRCELRIGRR
jgi:hypothetical protein